jgi:hypothetical protein
MATSERICLHIPSLILLPLLDTRMCIQARAVSWSSGSHLRSPNQTLTSIITPVPQDTEAYWGMCSSLSQHTEVHVWGIQN